MITILPLAIKKNSTLGNPRRTNTQHFPLNGEARVRLL